MRPVCLALVLALPACAASSEPNDAKTPTNGQDAKSGGPATDVTASPSASASAAPLPGPGINLSCRLPAPVVSDDSCSKDADCAPSTPCHARACVAVSKAVPRKPDTVCSMNIDCSSADVNPCTCYEGRCALVPAPN